MKKCNLVIDVALCNDCNDCFLSDRDEFVGNDFPPYSVAQPWTGQRWMNIERKERGQYPMVQVAYLPVPCMHCDDAPCIKDSPAGTVYKREDGLVIIDPEKAKGHPEIVDTCPYGAIYWNDEAKVAQKCTGCAHLMDDGWKDTRCSQVCPTGAIKLAYAEDAEMAAKAKAEGLEAFKPELSTAPRVWYKNLHRWTKSFIGGTLACKVSDECVEGATVTVSAGGQKVGEATSNNFGDFNIDKLNPGTKYEVAISAAGYKPVTQSVDLGESINLGVIFLEK